jgi:hypothetical protein
MIKFLIDTNVFIQAKNFSLSILFLRKILEFNIRSPRKKYSLLGEICIL